MNVALVMVSTVDGKITRGNSADVSEWTSKEDKKRFAKIVDVSKVIVMGSRTYEAYRDRLKPESGKLRIIMTTNPKRYEADKIDGTLEFTSESPADLMSRLETEGYKEVLLTGGGVINRLFFEAGLVTEIYLTLEPRIFGQGTTIVDQEALNVNLKLVALEKLNEQGTIFLHYKVVKD